MTPPGPGRWYVLGLALLAAVAALCVTPPPGLAAPGDPPGADGESADPSLLDQVAAASRAYLEAQASLEASRSRQRELTERLTTSEARAVSLSTEVNDIASTAYRHGGGMQTLSALLTSDSPTGLLDRMTNLSAIGSYKARQLEELTRVRADLAEARAAIDAEVADQEKQLAEMARRKEAAERALAQAGSQATGGPGGRSTAVATPAPRRADGSWPPESCSVDDPTTSGCLTPRTLHALQQARAAGFTRYTACYRSSGSGEHPKGRACDFAAAPSGFGGVATGDERTYGNNLAAYFVANAGRLAVLYVIWFRQIWLPSSGWRAYTSGNGDPASDHTNHVHLSVY
jgi:peptidoglycan DL-endopeptidase CwlO